MKPELKSSRYPNRIKQEKALLYEVLDEARFCTIAYAEEDIPYQIPTGFCRIGHTIYIHGSTRSHLIDRASRVKKVCISAMVFDGLVLAPTAFDHSVNYRSVVIFAKAEMITDMVKKMEVLKTFTEKYVPGRMSDVRPPNDGEMKKTAVLGFDLTESSVKSRSGQVGVDTTKEGVWAGIVPVSLAYGLPEADPNLPLEIGIPDYLTKMIVTSNAQ